MAITVTRSRAAVAALVVLVLLAVAGRRLAGTGAASEAAPPAAVLRPVAPAAAPKVVVHVAGAVRRPGLYRLRDGSRVADAVARAGGATRKADLAAVNLAAPVVDGSQVLLPSRAVVPGAGASAGAATAATPQKVSLASATIEQLDTLPGIGPVTAQRIVEHRDRHGPFRSIDDLDAVSGIGPARVEQLRELVTP